MNLNENLVYLVQCLSYKYCLEEMGALVSKMVLRGGFED